METTDILTDAIMNESSFKPTDDKGCTLFHNGKEWKYYFWGVVDNSEKQFLESEMIEICERHGIKDKLTVGFLDTAKDIKKQVHKDLRNP